LIGLVVVECEKPKFFNFKDEHFQGISVGTLFVFLMSGSSFCICFLAKCLEIQPWIVEDEKQLRNTTGAQKAQLERCLFRQIP
jgi:hypothetical protein